MNIRKMGQNLALAGGLALLAQTPVMAENEEVGKYDFPLAFVREDLKDGSGVVYTNSPDLFNVVYRDGFKILCNSFSSDELSLRDVRLLVNAQYRIGRKDINGDNTTFRVESGFKTLDQNGPYFLYICGPK